MEKKLLRIERELKCKSANIIWPLMSTPSGLAKWIADDVEERDDRLVFTWGDVLQHHEIQTARILNETKFDSIRFAWDNEDDDAYWELKIERSDITGDFILIITDFALDEDIDGLTEIWESNLTQLHHNTGL